MIIKCWFMYDQHENFIQLLELYYLILYNKAVQISQHSLLYQ